MVVEIWVPCFEYHRHDFPVTCEQRWESTLKRLTWFLPKQMALCSIQMIRTCLVCRRGPICMATIAFPTSPNVFMNRFSHHYYFANKHLLFIGFGTRAPCLGLRLLRCHIRGESSQS